jgi:hypothetical protein
MRDTIELPAPLRRLIPPRIKRPVKAALLSYIWRQAIRDLAKLRPGAAPSRELLRKLRMGWDNHGFDAKLDYFEEIVRHAVRTQGPILECGSGLTTIVLGHLAGRRNVGTWSLEHDVEWYRRVSSTIDRHEVPGAEVCLAPLRDYGHFNWYDHGTAKLPEKFSLVICDGPPDLANGGRYGLLPVLGERLESGAVILFDDAAEAGQQEVLRRWVAERGVSVDLRKTAEVCFAVVTCP